MKPAALNDLQNEHQCLLGQAEQIEHQLDRIREGARPDYALLTDRVRFLKDHYVGVHGPKDDVLVGKLVEGSDSVSGILTPFLNAHASAFLEHLDTLETDLQAVLCERLVPRALLLYHGDNALRHLRQQIATEESATFPWARKRLAERDWRQIGRSIRAVSRGSSGDDCAAAAELFPGSRQAPPASPVRQ